MRAADMVLEHHDAVLPVHSAKVLSLDDFVASAVRDLHPYFKRFVCAIFGVDARGIPYPVGSGVLLGVGRYCFLITAAHVLDERVWTTLYVWGEESLVALDGKYHSLIAPASGRNEDRLDFGFVRLADNVAAELASHYAFLDPPDLNVNEVENQSISGVARYVLVGYPGSRNKPRPIRKLRLASVMVSLFPAPLEKYRTLGLSLRTHVVADFKRKHLANQKGAPTRGPKPDGMSGGGVWFVGDSELLRRTQRPKLTAIFIEHRSPERAFIAVRISLIVAAVLAAYPDTAPLLPQSRLVHPKVDLVHTIGK